MANVEFIDKKRIRVVAQNGDEYVIGFDSTMNYHIQINSPIMYLNK